MGMLTKIAFAVCILALISTDAALARPLRQSAAPPAVKWAPVPVLPKQFALHEPDIRCQILQYKAPAMADHMPLYTAPSVKKYDILVYDKWLRENRGFCGGTNRGGQGFSRPHSIIITPAR